METTWRRDHGRQQDGHVYGLLKGWMASGQDEENSIKTSDWSILLAVVANSCFTEKLFFYRKGAEHGHKRTPARGAAAVRGNRSSDAALQALLQPHADARSLANEMGRCSVILHQHP